ncbi:ABC transporter permease [Pontimonas sp.]|uniref:ABC transporter permease n=1 Tax=Pontimonas sp. TaxID=2304492 RepID=UPI0028701040|nr:ABC transporter permease [Pontimonas sp.]MDR9434062.1 ABC transporter permease [Pontimonas sp.]
MSVADGLTTAASRRWRPPLLALLWSLTRRLARVFLVVWAAASVGFIALMVVPGDPVDVMLGVQAQVSDSVREQIRADWGLDQPPVIQYLEYMSRLFQGDLGQSYQLRAPVTDVLAQQIGPTLQLSAAAVLLAAVMAALGAVFGRGKKIKRFISLVELVVISSPTFWIGLLLLAVFAFRLDWFPVLSSAGLASLVLPALTLALPVAGITSQVLRQGLDFAEGQPFATTAKSRGITPARLVSRHTLRHAAMDTLTLSGFLLGSLLGGTVLVETVFARPGLGQVAIRAIIGRDLPVILGVIVLSAFVFAVINLAVDVSYRALDPRLRASKMAKQA